MSFSTTEVLGKTQKKDLTKQVNWGLTFTLILLCLTVVYAVGLESMAYAHNSFHDVRHASGFPCH
jgi:cobalt transporter subunit CbtB